MRNHLSTATWTLAVQRLCGSHCTTGAPILGAPCCSLLDWKKPPGGPEWRDIAFSTYNWGRPNSGQSIWWISLLGQDHRDLTRRRNQKRAVLGTTCVQAKDRVWWGLLAVKSKGNLRSELLCFLGCWPGGYHSIDWEGELGYIHSHKHGHRGHMAGFATFPSHIEYWMSRNLEWVSILLHTLAWVRSKLGRNSELET